MSLLLDVLYAAHARSTHHKLALDALAHLEHPLSVPWRTTFLTHYARYLAGAKDPDDRFKDFRNHVLHVRQNLWGGAIPTAKKWYIQAVEQFRRRNWSEGVYAAGVLSHYFTDPVQPFHTHQTEAENNIHRAFEWSTTKSYEELRNLLDQRLGYPLVDLRKGEFWLDDLIERGARLSNRFYEPLIDHYDFYRGSRNPPEGFDEFCRLSLARLIGWATVGWAHVLDRLFEEAGVVPPSEGLTLATFVATLDMPVKWITNKIADVRERALIEQMYAEFQQTGRVDQFLPQDDRTIRDLVAAKTPKKMEFTATRSPIAIEKPRQIQVESLPDSKSVMENFSSEPVITQRVASEPVETPKETRVVEVLAQSSVLKDVCPPDPALLIPQQILPAISDPVDLTEEESTAEFSIEAGTPPVPDAVALQISVETDPSDAASMSSKTDSDLGAKPIFPEMTEVDFESDNKGSGEMPEIHELKSTVFLRLDPVHVQLEKHMPVVEQSVTDRKSEDQEFFEESTPDKDSLSRQFESSLEYRLDEKHVPSTPHVSQGDEPRFERIPFEPAVKREKIESWDFEVPPAEILGQEVVGRPQPFRYYLESDSPIVDAPSIGPKTAKRMKGCRIRTVNDLLQADPQQLAGDLKSPQFTVQIIRNLQDQARLVCGIPEMRGHDAQLLVGCAIRDVRSVADSELSALTQRVVRYAKSPAGQRILRNGEIPDEEEVRGWITQAKRGRGLNPSFPAG